MPCAAPPKFDWNVWLFWIGRLLKVSTPLMSVPFSPEGVKVAVVSKTPGASIVTTKPANAVDEMPTKAAVTKPFWMRCAMLMVTFFLCFLGCPIPKS